jgi:hypothetical protein
MKLQELNAMGFSTVDIPRYEKIDVNVVRVAKTLWSFLGVRPKITSSYRTPVQNAQVQGSANSQHIQGKALDLIFPGVDPAKVIAAAEQLQAKGLALQYPTGAVHIDTRDGPIARWGELVDAGVKSFDHPLAEIVAMFTTAVAGPLTLGPTPIPQTTAGKVGAGVLIVGAVVLVIILLTR